MGLVLAALCLSFSTGCERYDRPRKPLPADFEVTTLDGRTLRRDDFLGKPWVINLWVPG